MTSLSCSSIKIYLPPHLQMLYIDFPSSEISISSTHTCLITRESFCSFNRPLRRTLSYSLRFISSERTSRKEKKKQKTKTKRNETFQAFWTSIKSGKCWLESFFLSGWVRRASRWNATFRSCKRKKKETKKEKQIQTRARRVFINFQHLIERKTHFFHWNIRKKN